MSDSEHVSLAQALDLALTQHRQGNLDGAAQVYDAILAAVPHHLDTLAARGCLYAQQGQLAEAERMLRQVVQSDERQTESWLNLGIVYHSLGQAAHARPCFAVAVEQRPNAQTWQWLATVAGDNAEAETAWRQVVRYDPGNAPAHCRLGDLQRLRGDLAAAEHSLLAACAADPGLAEAWFLRGVLALDGDTSAAIGYFRQALSIRPNWADAWFHLGNLQCAQRAYADAEHAYRQVLREQPQHADALNNLGNALREQGRYQAAITCYQQSLALQPHNVRVWENLGLLQHQVKLYADAEQSYERALALDADDPAVLCLLGSLYADQQRSAAAIHLFDRALALQPHFPVAYTNRANAFAERGELSAAMSDYRSAIAQDPTDATPRHNLLLTMHYDPQQTPAALYEAHRTFAAGLVAKPLALGNQRRPGRSPRPLRIAYLSPDFRTHSTAYFIEGVLRAHDRQQFELFAYSNHPVEDEVTARLRALVPNWRAIAKLDDAAVVDLILADAIDILIDLAGHTAHNRLAVFACRPAPLQLTWIGYPNTTGLDCIDYRVTDGSTDPPGAEAYYTERLLRLPRLFSSYLPPDFAPEVAPLPGLSDGDITFGSFNKRPKLNDAVFDVWAGILQRVPRSRLLLKAAALGDEYTRDALTQAFSQRGVAAHRLQLLGKVADAVNHLDCYRQLDIALDPFPYNGTTTTCEALWMGVPVVALRGGHHLARVSASQLDAIGAPEWVANSPDEYIDIACRLADDRAALANIRGGLRERMRQSPLLDSGALTLAFESALRQIWRDDCATD